MDESGLVNSTEEKRDSSCTVMNLAVADSSTFELETLHRVNVDLAWMNYVLNLVSYGSI